MEAGLHVLAGYLTLALDAIALLMVTVGAVTALAELGMALGRRHIPGARVRAIFIEFGRWLVAALTFQLGSDIAATTIAPGWDQLGQLAAVAAIRTGLTYFLDRDLDKARDEQNVQAKREPTVQQSR
jgi:uncharacterized membrane protein